MENRKYYVCKTIRLLEYLIRKGHNVYKVQSNDKCTDRVVFVFRYSDKLQEDVDTYYKRVNKKFK